MFVMFSKHVDTMESNKAEVLAILNALRFSFHGNLVVESDSLNAISWVSSPSKVP